MSRTDIFPCIVDCIFDPLYMSFSKISIKDDIPRLHEWFDLWLLFYEAEQSVAVPSQSDKIETAIHDWLECREDQYMFFFSLISNYYRVRCWRWFGWRNVGRRRGLRMRVSDEGARARQGIRDELHRFPTVTDSRPWCHTRGGDGDGPMRRDPSFSAKRFAVYLLFKRSHDWVCHMRRFKKSSDTTDIGLFSFGTNFGYTIAKQMYLKFYCQDDEVPFELQWVFEYQIYGSLLSFC